MKIDEEVREFLIECGENLANLDREIVLLEATPHDMALVASIFRTVHTIKGTCGFFGFNTLGAVSHVAESILDQVRTGEREWVPSLTSIILESVDVIKALLLMIESEGVEGPNQYLDLRSRLTDCYQSGKQTSTALSTPAPQSFEAAPPTVNAIPEEISKDNGSTGQNPVEKIPLDTKEPNGTLDQFPSKGTSLSDVAADAVTAIPAPVVLTAPAQKLPQPSLEEPVRTTGLTESSIRVDVGLLDKLMNLVGELVLARNQLLQATSGQDAMLIRTVQRLNLITSELQESVLKTRMQPIGVVWNKLPRVIRDLAAECHKKIQLDMEGSETELDKTIIEAIKDPLTHIVRNSCDHGIESPETRVQKGKPAEGLVQLRAYHEGGHVVIEISDDGGGLNPEILKARALQKGLIRVEQAELMTEREALHLVFKPGFSTAEKITNISGRGVGMDVVKTNIQKIGGVVDIFNRTGLPGSTVKIKIPLTLAIIPGLVINAIRRGEDSTTLQEHRFVIPQASLLELVRLEGESGRQQVEYVNGTPVYRRRGQLLPLAYLSSVLGIAESSFPTSDVVNIVVLQAEDRPFGLIVDGIRDTQEIVVKPLGKRLKGLSSYLGSTIMGDGRVALILDVPGLARLAGVVSQSRDIKKLDTFSVEGESVTPQTFLIFRAGKYARLAVPLALVARLEQFPRKSIESASGRPVLYYRQQILPLLALDRLLDPAHVASTNDSDSIQVIVFGEDGGRIGIVVDQIVDIIEEPVTFTQTSQHPGLLGSAVVGGTITDLLDLDALIKTTREDSLNGDTTRGKQKHVLLVDSSTIRRTMLRSFLMMHSYRVDEAESVEDALLQLESSATKQRTVDLVLTTVPVQAKGGLKKPSLNGPDLLSAIRTNPIFGQLPLIAIVPEGISLPEASDSVLQFDAVEMASDRMQLLKTMQNMLRSRPMPAAVYEAMDGDGNA